MDATEGAHVGVHGCPLVEASVLSSLQQELTTAVVGQLVEDKGALQHVGRVNLPQVPAFGQVVDIFRALQHLTAEVRTLVHTDPEHVGGLKHKDRRRDQMKN